MSVKYNIDNDKIELLMEDSFSIDEILSTIQEALNEITSPLPILVDVTRSEELKSGQELEKFAQFLRSKKDKITPRLAIVVTQTVRYGTGRQVGTYLEMCGIESKPFYDKNQALVWLLGK